jgi:hypothetical protein
MGVVSEVFKIREQRSGNPLTPGGGDDGEPLNSQVIDRGLKTDSRDCVVIDPRQHRSTVIQSTLHIGYALTINPRRRVQYPTIFNIGRLGDAVDTGGIFTGGMGEAHIIGSHIPLERHVTIIQLPVEAIPSEGTTILHPTSMTVSSLVV